MAGIKESQGELHLEKKRCCCLRLITSEKEMAELLADNTMVLLYFGSDNCGVCRALQPKCKQLVADYPNIVSGKIDTTKSAQLAASHMIFTIPAILVFVHGKEVIREARHISMRDLAEKIRKFYHLVFSY